jgi:asparagine synthase (glutamine-hydrolysing)
MERLAMVAGPQAGATSIVCGICGIARAEGAVDMELIGAMSQTLRHRGPDDQGVWSSLDGRIGLGHRRLSIIDLSAAGHQPMQDASGRLRISFNGEIYNYLELREELRRLGHAFHTATDTEVILEAYREWGLDAVKKLNGMFAFALYDLDRRRLFLARDRAGEKPLFYRHSRGVFSFGSELKALMQDPAFDRVIDPLALNQYLAFGYIPGDSCIFKGVRKLTQGCGMTYDLDGDAVKVWPYWTLPPPMNGQAPAAEEELLEELERLLLDSVRMRLIADVPVGIMLSGGVDSSLVTAMAARVSSKPVHTFNISFPGHGVSDESPFARMVARHFGTDHVELAAEPTTVDLLPALARQYDEPMADSSMVPTYLVSRLIRGDATVALGGDGGDELFGGYHHYEWVRRQDLVRRMIPAPLRRVASAFGRSLPAGVRGRNYLASSGREIDWSIANANVYFDVQARRRLLASSGVPVDDSAEMQKATLTIGHSAVQRAMAMDFRSYLVDDILVKVDRASMLTSLEVRAPLLDHRIIDFAYGRVPDSMRAWRGQRKVLLRKLAYKLLPPELDVTRKQGFSIPLGEWFRGDWGRYMCDVLLESEGSFFDKRAIQSLISRQELGLATTHLLFALTIFELWRREYRPSL